MRHSRFEGTRSGRTLARIAQDPSARPLVRADAGEALHELGHATLAWQAFAEILAGLPRDFRPWPDLVRPLARTNDMDLFVDLATKEALTGPRWGQLLDALKDDSRSPTLEALAANERLPESQKLAVHLRLIKDTEQAIELLRSVPDEVELIKPCVLLLQNALDTFSLLRVATGADFSARRQLLAVRALRSIKAVEALRQIVNSTSSRYRLRRQAAEALYRTRVDRETATVLLTFFEAVPGWCRPPAHANSLRILSVYPGRVPRGQRPPSEGLYSAPRHVLGAWRLRPLPRGDWPNRPSAWGLQRSHSTWLQYLCSFSARLR